jgi:hypothetical protein
MQVTASAVISFESRVKAFTFQLLPFTSFGYCSRKEVFQPHLPVRLPCYDLAPVTDFTLGRSLR